MAAIFYILFSEEEKNWTRWNTVGGGVGHSGRRGLEKWKMAIIQNTIHDLQKAQVLNLSAGNLAR
jgi:hypothetical protein